MSFTRKVLETKMKNIRTVLIMNKIDVDKIKDKSVFKTLISKHVNGKISMNKLITTCKNIEIMAG